MEGLGMKVVGSEYSFWHGKRVCITGHTGFKGSWLTLWLNMLGAKVYGVALPPNTNLNLFTLARVAELSESHFCDVRNDSRLKELLRQAQPEIVFHLAAQPLVRESYLTPVETFATNVIGTVNVLDALRSLDGLLAAVFITTDKVYKNNEWLWGYRENDELGGYDPYSASKAASELAINSYRCAFLADRGVSIASARAGNVIGGGDYSADRLLPDAIRAWQSGQPLLVRRPNSTRPWQHVLDALAGYLSLAAKIAQPGCSTNEELCSAFNFGPSNAANATVQDVIELAQVAYGDVAIAHNKEIDSHHEASALFLDATKSKSLLGYETRWSLQESVRRTIAWYRAVHQGAKARDLCEKEIQDYQALC